MSVDLERIPLIVSRTGNIDSRIQTIVDTVDRRAEDLEILRHRFPHRTINIKIVLRQQATKVLMPVGVERPAPRVTPRVLYRETAYLPKRWHREVMRASAWELVAQPYLDALAETNYYGIGLSVGAAMLWAVAKLGAINRYTIGDPDTMDGINGGRHVWWDPFVAGWNKTEVAARELITLDPYLSIRKFRKGLTPKNEKRFFKGIDERTSIIVQEVDHPPTKDLAHSKLNATRIQVGDVGKGNITLTVDKPGDPAFNGRTQGKQGMDALLASIDNRIGDDLRTLMPRIGKEDDIATVPQDFGAVLLAAAVARQFIPLVASREYDRLPRVATLNLSEDLKVWEH